MNRKIVPSFISFLFLHFALLWSALFLGRCCFAYFLMGEQEIPFKAWQLGMRFDLKLTAILLFPLLVFLYFLRSKFLKRSLWRTMSKTYLWLVYVVVLVAYVIDAGYYQYLDTRIDSNALRFTDQGIGTYLTVLWQSYPVVKILIGIFFFLFFVKRLFKIIDCRYTTQKFGRLKNIGFGLLGFLCLSFAIYNSFSHFPLRWSQAFFSKKQSVNQFALNPILYFFETFTDDQNQFDLERTKAYYPAIAQELNLDKTPLHFQRRVTFPDTLAPKPNIVVVLLESFGASVMSHFGNPIKTTPKMDSIANHSLFFTNSFVHKIGTAPSVFASITGLPDVVSGTTASRTPLIIDQRILFDQFDDYEKYFFIASSANWANIRGVFGSNIEGLHIYEEGSYDTGERADVWGIDDYELFKEADKVLAQQKKPFVAYIETASNHMPFTYPNKRGSFTPWTSEDIDETLLKKGGFRSLKQLNALRYLDFNVNRFLERAKKSGYYDHTIFVFFGDHNTWVGEFDFTPLKEYELGIQSHHVPAFIHAPKYLKPNRYDDFSKLIDLFPTAANLAQQSHINYTLGCDLLGAHPSKSAFLYTKLKGEYAVAVLKGMYYYVKSLQSENASLYHLDKPNEDLIDKEKSIGQSLDSLAMGFYESTRYLYFNNGK